jgi:hypothetical protein
VAAAAARADLFNVPRFLGLIWPALLEEYYKALNYATKVLRNSHHILELGWRLLSFSITDQ